MLPLVEQFQEFAVRDRLDGAPSRPHALEQHQQCERADQVPDVPLLLLVHFRCSFAGPPNAGDISKCGLAAVHDEGPTRGG